MAAKFSNQNWRPLVIRDNMLFVRGNVSGFQTQGQETGVNALTGFNNNPGSFSDVPAVIAIAHEFGKAAQIGNINSIDSEVLLNYAGNMQITSGQHIAAVRGMSTVGSLTTLTSGSFTYGVQGRLAIQGAVDLGSGFAACLFGKLDCSASTSTVTSGYVSALHLDMGSTSHLSSSAYINAATITNTTQCLINSCFKVIANATYFMDIAESNLTGHWIVGTTASTAAGALKVLVNGATRYIQLYSGIA